MRNVLGIVPKGNSEMVAAAIRTVIAQPDAARVSEQFDTIAVMLGRQLPKVETMMRDAKDDLLAFSAFPQLHWRQLWSTNPLERTNKEISAAPTSSGCFRTRPRCSAWPAPYWSNNTTNGPPLTAALQRTLDGPARPRARDRRAGGHPRTHDRMIRTLTPNTSRNYTTRRDVTNPSSRPSTNRARHFPTVAGAHPNCSATDLLSARPVGAHQHDPRPQRQRLRGLRPPSPAGQLLPLLICEHPHCLRASRAHATTYAPNLRRRTLVRNRGPRL